MAKSDELPGFVAKRKILFGARTTPEQMTEMALRFMAQERYDDALEFLAKTDAHAPLDKIVRIAIDRGDTPLLLRAKAVLKQEPTDRELLVTAKQAEAAGRPSMAYVAYVKAGNEQEAERLRGEIAATLKTSWPDAAQALPETEPNDAADADAEQDGGDAHHGG